MLSEALNLKVSTPKGWKKLAYGVPAGLALSLRHRLVVGVLGEITRRRRSRGSLQGLASTLCSFHHHRASTISNPDSNNTESEDHRADPGC